MGHELEADMEGGEDGGSETQGGVIGGQEMWG